MHPLLVYYSQEARGYAAVALACAVGFLYFLDAIEGRRGALGWAVASAVALGCHYFAVFPIAIEAAILLARRGRAALPALAGVGVVGLGLLPLALEQIGGEHGDNVTGGTGLAERAKGAATSWLVGERGAAIDGLEWLAGALLVAGVVVLVVRGDVRAALLPAVVGGGGATLMLLAAAFGADYLNNRNTIPVLDDRARGSGAGVRARPARSGARGGGVRGAARGDDRGADGSRARARGLAGRGARAAGTQAVVVAPPFNETPLRWYAPGLRSVPTAAAQDLAIVIPDPKRDPLAPDALRRRPPPASAPPARRRAAASSSPATAPRARAPPPRGNRRVGARPAGPGGGGGGGVLLAR